MIYILIIICGVLAGVFLNKESKGQYVPAVILKGLASLCFVKKVSELDDAQMETLERILNEPESIEIR